MYFEYFCIYETNGLFRERRIAVYCTLRCNQKNTFKKRLYFIRPCKFGQTISFLIKYTYDNNTNIYFMGNYKNIKFKKEYIYYQLSIGGYNNNKCIRDDHHNDTREEKEIFFNQMIQSQQLIFLLFLYGYFGNIPVCIQKT